VSAPVGGPVGESAAVGTSTGRVLAKASLILTVAGLASRLLGWLRLSVIGSQFGASRELDAYFAAFRIPDLLYQLVIAGALGAALIPVFSSYRARGEEAEAWRLASSVINLVLIVLAGFALVMAILAPWLVPFIAPGFDAHTTELTVRMTRVMLLSPIFIGMGAVVSGILNSYEHFALPAIAPLVYNGAIILAAVVLAPLMGVEALAVGVALGSLAHLAIQLPQLRTVGRRYRLTLEFAHPGVRRVAWLMGPRVIGLAAGQVNFIVATVLASGLVAGSLTAFNYAFQLMQVPAGVLGVSVAVAIFPGLSRAAALGRVGDVRRQVAKSLRLQLFVIVPLMAIMLVLGNQITASVFQYGRFTADATSQTANALLFFTIGLIAYTVVNVLARAFYALQDTRTPVGWAIAMVALNVPLMVLLTGPLGIRGLALALSITANLQVMGLYWALHRRLGGLALDEMIGSLVRSAVAGGVAGGLLFAGAQLAERWLPEAEANGFGRLALLGVLSSLGLAAYLAVGLLLRAPEIGELRELLRRRRRHPAKAAE